MIQKNMRISDINHLSNQEQAEVIAESINKISQEYTEVKVEEMDIPIIPPDTTPQFSPWEIKKYINRVKTNKATITGDIPAKVVKHCSAALCIPMTHMINHNIMSGSWPDQYKIKTLTPIAKQTPIEHLDQIRPISNLPISDKIQEAVISNMKDKLDPFQYGNQKKTSIEHYLVKMMHQIVTSMDRNFKEEVNAVIALFVDWKSTYSRQCHTLGIK